MVPYRLSMVERRFVIQSLSLHNFPPSQYNIPIQMYLTEKYPQVPPQIYVRPTASNQIIPLSTLPLTITLLFHRYGHQAKS